MTRRSVHRIGELKVRGWPHSEVLYVVTGPQRAGDVPRGDPQE